MANQIEIHTEGSRRFTLSSAILIYESARASHAGEIFATLHAVERNRKGGAQLAAGVPATKESCAEFARTIADQGAFAGFLSPDLLYVGPQIVAWWRKPLPARVWFECEHPDEPKKHLGKLSAVTPHPGLVFMLAAERWFVYAIKGAARPSQDTRLYRAPYFNVWDNGGICEGNVERPKRVTPATIAGFERAFFDSRFTHPNGSGMTLHKGGLYALWRELLEGRWKDQFPQQTLAAHGRTTLAECVRKHEGHKRGE